MKDDFLTLSMYYLSGWSHCTLSGCPRWLLGCYSIIIVFRSKSQPAKAGNVHMCREVRREGLLSSSSSYLSQLWASLNPIASIMKVNLWLGFLLFFALRSPEIRLTSPFTIFKTWVFRVWGQVHTLPPPVQINHGYTEVMRVGQTGA